MAGKKTLGWLHLTDLHRGQPKEIGQLRDIEKKFLRSLEGVMRSGEIGVDLVFFSGDLVFKGSDGEFVKATAFLGRILQHIQELNADLGLVPDSPVLLPVPGNHDFARPDAAGIDVLNRVLASRDAESTALSGKPLEEARAVIGPAFEGYKRWLRHPLPFPKLWDNGLFPGDMRATVQRQDTAVGVVCLNGAYLHTSDKCRGALHLDQTQVMKFGESLNEWRERHDFAVLMTHHPPSWFSEEARKVLEGELLGSGVFDIYLFGHEHPGGHEARPGTAGIRHLLKGRSLYAAKEDGSTRLHGYTVGRFDIDGGHRSIEVCPHSAWRTKEWHFGPVAADGPGNWKVTIDLDELDAARADRKLDPTVVDWIPDLGNRGSDAKSHWAESYDDLAAKPERERWVFLSASIPQPDDDDDRRKATEHLVESARPDLIKQFVRTLVPALEQAGWGIVCGGAPSITELLAPIVLDHERDSPWLLLYQHEIFWDSFVEDVGVIAWTKGVSSVLVRQTPGSADQDTELGVMRDAMFALDGLDAAVFVGGLDGIRKEYDKIAAKSGIRRFALGAGGGEAAEILMDEGLDASGHLPGDRGAVKKRQLKNPGPLWHSPEKAVEAILKALGVGPTP